MEENMINQRLPGYNQESVLIQEIQNLKNEFNLFKEKSLTEIEKLNLRINKIEIENEKLKNMILSNNNDLLFKESKIIRENDNKEFLKYWLRKEIIKTSLIYSAKIDGDTIDEFNKNCNEKANTL